MHQDCVDTERYNRRIEPIPSKGITMFWKPFVLQVGGKGGAWNFRGGVLQSSFELLECVGIPRPRYNLRISNLFGSVFTRRSTGEPGLILLLDFIQEMRSTE